MSKIRINELARELEVKPGKIIDLLPELGVDDKKTHSSSLDDDLANNIRKHFGVDPVEATSDDSGDEPDYGGQESEPPPPPAAPAVMRAPDSASVAVETAPPVVTQPAPDIVPPLAPDLPSGNRFADLTRVDLENLSRLAAKLGRRADVVTVLWQDMERRRKAKAKPPKTKAKTKKT